ncbi:bifunctional UDP-N-acetylmuramoyl-tripeptide:D-alanyl-D-alanine ligase/alanine racemase [Olivibacter sitiensis]|uniref:bifunctional UDP-N-acetylmuramoyl-tripeptide:D-alanyl-D-alanine ligase/alanine racemase n=1 Tax=Olivibacter sitiensis TaxID=376470 RepID=UPI00041397D3|nr:bifunctional UDP-N-acetylmuramoyl-tripeptide:D-alanyl-D-alanine ligase/alanine racemase [Olivibacter sitiensis]
MSTKTYHIAQIAELLGCPKAPYFQQDSSISWLGYDSRKIGDAKATLFFALQGRRNGHDYLAEAYKKGVRHFVVSEDRPYGDLFPEANFLLVPDTLMALQKLAAYHRSQFHYPVVAITGSNGKTVVKEWLYELLSPDYSIVRSPKSYNSQLGVALSLWAMNESANLAIIEAGISQAGEMQALQTMIKPSIGILTNIGTAHDAGFDSVEQKVQEKLSLFTNVSTLIYSPKYLHGQQISQQAEKSCSWGEQGSEDLAIINYAQTTNGYTTIKARYNGKEISITAPFTDAASLENVVCCWATLLALGYDHRTIAQRVASLSAISMRLELKNGINSCSIIDDSYSNDISSLEIALDFLSQQQQHQAKVLILSDMPIQGMEDVLTYQRVAELVNRQRLSLFVGIGEQLSRYRHLFAGKTAFYPSTASFLASGLSFQHSTILLKGARSYSFERISKTLSAQMHDTVLEINLNALENNLNQYRMILPEGVKLMAMVKAFSYGSGSFEIANVLQFNKVDYLTVAYADEGIALRRAGITLPIMVMNAGIQNMEMLLRYDLEPEIYNLHELQALSRAIIASNVEGVSHAVHIKLDTGMHRLGFMEDELEALIKLLHQMPHVKVKSVFSHLVASGDSSQDDYTRKQIALFKDMASRIKASLPYEIWMHIANTSAISRFPEANFDMVRLGIGLYGVSADETQPIALSTVATLKTKITQIKHIPAGDTIGYNRHGRLKGNGSGMTATVKIGYADGYNRRLGNGHCYMLIGGQAAYTVGDICMDMCMLDITGLPNISEGDEVIIMGEKPHVNELAKAIGTIPYEVLTGISPRVKRVYYYE